ncbi:Centromere/kinetochore protein zw10 [Gryllus bimaculatus]|nr:Centromere/kinetochore protein zw10 [Gryllus bimaculatus]
MASFVTEIVRCADKVELDDLNKNIEDLSRSVFNLKCEVAKEMENTYVSFLKMPAKNKKLMLEVKQQSARMEIIQDKVDKMVKHELESSTGELHTLSTKLMEVGLKLGHVTQLVLMDNALQAAVNAHEAQEFPQAAKHTQHLLHLLDDLSPENASLKIYTSLRSEARLIQERLLYDLKEVWKTGLRWEEPEPDIEGLGLKDSMTKRKKPYRAALHVDTSCLNKLEGVFIALSILGNFDYHVSKFASNFMRLVLQPLTTQEGQVNVLQVTDDNSEALLEIETHPNKTHPSYMSVLQNLRKVFEFTRQYLILQVEDARDGEPLVTLVNRMGAVIGAQLCEMLVTGCLAHTVPAYGHDLNTFRQAAAEAEAFHHELKSIGFLPEENESLVKYAANIDVLFANKICELHLHTAREIARKDLHDTMDVGIIIPKQELPCKDDEPDIKPIEKLSDYTFQFPKCQISKSAHELVELLRRLLAEAEKGSDVSSGRLLLTARQVVELYWAVSHTHHQQMLSTIPQQVALFHNNCMYIAHHLVTLGAEHQGQGFGVNFLDQVQGLRELGANVLLQCTQTSRQQIINILRESGCLLNALVEELVLRIVNLEDIPAHVATLLAAMFSDVLERAPQVFPDTREVHRHVHKWHQLEALVKVLRASLTEIADNWASGAGPLARAFSANELKQLIRALFQNNKRRAAILALIK